MERPGRPLGVSLAIFASLLVFTVSPLLQVGLLFVVRQHFIDQSLPSMGGEPIVSGGDILDIPIGTLVVQAALAIIFLVAAVPAWRGRPRWMRFGLVSLVMLYTLIKFVTIIAQGMSAQNLQIGVSSGDAIFRSFAAGELVTEFLVMLYVIWYMNRGPARAFYRGSYLPEPVEPVPTPELQQTE